MPDLTDTRVDAERVVIDVLNEELAGVPVKAAFDPVEDEPLPVVLVHRAGGGPRFYPPVLDEGLIGLDVYGETKAQAWDLAAQCLERLVGIEGEFVGSPPHAWVSAVEDAGSTLWLPDERTGRARYSAVVRVYARGESAVGV